MQIHFGPVRDNTLIKHTNRRCVLRLSSKLHSLSATIVECSAVQIKYLTDISDFSDTGILFLIYCVNLLSEIYSYSLSVEIIVAQLELS